MPITSSDPSGKKNPEQFRIIFTEAIEFLAIIV
jgi:hypothetical protein